LRIARKVLIPKQLAEVKRSNVPAIPGVKIFSINTKDYSSIFKIFARTIFVFFNVSSPYKSYNNTEFTGQIRDQR
jgi:hypothetical protein